MSQADLQKIRRAANRAARARADLDQAIREARANGESLRRIATWADLSPEWVRRISSASK